MKLYAFEFHFTDATKNYKLMENEVVEETTDYYEVKSDTGRMFINKTNNLWQPGNQKPYNRHQHFIGEENIEVCRTMFLQEVEKEFRQQLEKVREDVRALEQGEEELHSQLQSLSETNLSYGHLVVAIFEGKARISFETLRDYQITDGVLRNSMLISDPEEYPQYIDNEFALDKANQWTDIHSLNVSQEMLVDGSTLEVKKLVCQYMSEGLKKLTLQLDEALTDYFQAVDLKEVA